MCLNGSTIPMQGLTPDVKLAVVGPNRHLTKLAVMGPNGHLTNLEVWSHGFSRECICYVVHQYYIISKKFHCLRWQRADTCGTCLFSPLLCSAIKYIPISALGRQNTFMTFLQKGKCFRSAPDGVLTAHAEWLLIPSLLGSHLKVSQYSVSCFGTHHAE